MSIRSGQTDQRIHKAVLATVKRLPCQGHNHRYSNYMYIRLVKTFNIIWRGPNTTQLKIEQYQNSRQKRFLDIDLISMIKFTLSLGSIFVCGKNKLAALVS